MQRYLTLAKIDLASTLLLFRGITKTKHGEHLRSNGGLSYTRMRELFRDMVKDIGLDPSQFGLHSLRAGGASAAANAGVPDHLFKRHDRWWSELAKDGCQGQFCQPVGGFQAFRIMITNSLCTCTMVCCVLAVLSLPLFVTLCCYTCNDFRRAQQTPSHQQIVVDNACWGYDLGDVFSVV